MAAALPWGNKAAAIIGSLCYHITILPKFQPVKFGWIYDDKRFCKLYLEDRK